MVAIRQHTSLSEMGALLPKNALCGRTAPPAAAGNLVDEGDAVTFHFEEPAADSADGRLTPAQMQAFHADFERELENLARWFQRQRWVPDCQPVLQVIVSHRFRISKSLVPAWHGQRGRMEFPVWRIAGGNAAIAHELTHVFFPNANRFLAEGLAVHVQAEIGGNPAFPNFGEKLHRLAHKILRDIEREFIGDAKMWQLADLDAIATPNPLTLEVGTNFYGEEASGQAVVYPIAGSFVSFLIETHGMDKFHELYRQTPFRPQTRDAGTADRWQNVYGISLADLEVEWKAMIVNCDPIAVDA